jgi:hypothetical protein
MLCNTASGSIESTTGGSRASRTNLLLIGGNGRQPTNAVLSREGALALWRLIEGLFSEDGIAAVFSTDAWTDFSSSTDRMISAMERIWRT